MHDDSFNGNSIQAYNVLKVLEQMEGQEFSDIRAAVEDQKTISTNFKYNVEEYYYCLTSLSEYDTLLLFLIPADSADHRKEFNILRNELEEYNPDMLQKDFVIAVSKSDMLDDELKDAIKKELPAGIPSLFISSVTNTGLNELKDLLWETLNKPAA